MGQERTVRVVAPGTGDDGQARPLVDAGLDLGQELKGHVRQDDDGLESFNLAEVLLIFGHEAAQGDIRPQADLGESVVDVGAVFPNEGESEGRAVFGQELAVAVLQKAARRVNALGAQMIGHGFAGQVLAAVDLQIPEAHHKDHEYGRHQGLQQNQAPARGLVVFNFQFNFGHGAPFYRAGQKP